MQYLTASFAQIETSDLRFSLWAFLKVHLFAGGPAYYVLHPQKGITI